VGLQMVDALTLKENIPFLRMVESGNAIEHHCFSGPIGTNDGMNFPFSHRDADVQEGPNTSKVNGYFADLSSSWSS